MTVTNQFFEWWFTAWNIGGWVLLFLASIGAIAWLIFDTATRRIRAVGWMMGAVLPLLLILPSAYVGLSPAAMLRMQDSLEVFFYLGLVGGLVPVIVAVGYGITYQGLCGCPEGHIYDATLDECPACAQQRRVAAAPAQPPMRTSRPVAPAPSAPPLSVPAPPAQPRAPAWLVDTRTQESYQLCQGDTRVGRSSRNNEVSLPDPAVSREHLLIREEEGHYTAYDRGSRAGTFVNGRPLEAPILLAHNDVLEIGDTRLRFVTAQG